MHLRNPLLYISLLIVSFFSITFTSCIQRVEEDQKVVVQTPVITAISSDVSTIFYKAVTLSIDAQITDGGTLSYQWYSATQDKLKAGIAVEDGDGFSGSTSKDFSPAVSTAGTFYYYCVVTNTLGGNSSSVTSPRITVIVDSVIHALNPVIISEPVNIKAIIPAEGTFTIGAASSDNGTLTYQWYLISADAEEGSEGTLITNATENSYKVTADEAGKTCYYCVVTNTIKDNGDGGKKTATITSKVVYFEAVNLKDTLNSPVFTKQPVLMNIANPSTVLSCEAAVPNGYSAFYRWYKTEDCTVESGVPVTDGWSSSPKFETPRFTERGIYYYYCRASSYIPNQDDITDEVTVCSDVVSVVYTGLPTLYLNTGDIPISAITKEEYVLGSFKMVSEQYGTLEYNFNKTDKKNGTAKEGIKGRGNSSWNMPKKGYNIKFDSKQSVLGMPAAKKWCIIANYSDKTLLRNKYASFLGNEIFNCEWNPGFEFVDVIMNGEYLGNYIFCEKNTISEDRINIQDITDCTEKKINDGKYLDKNNDGVINLYDGGFVLEIDARYDADFYFTSTKGVAFTLKDPDEVTDEALEHIKDIVQLAEDTLYSDFFSETLSENSDVSKWMRHCDVDSFIDWYLINEIGKNRDSCFYLSVYMYYDPNDEKLHLGPIWDFDPAFGNDGANGTIPSLQTSEGWYIKNSLWISRMFEDPRFVIKVKERWNEKKNTLQQTFFDNGIIQTLSGDIKVSANYNFIKWPILGAYVWPNPTGVETRLTYQSEIDYMKNWLSERYAWLDSAINGL